MLPILVVSENNSIYTGRCVTPVIAETPVVTLTRIPSSRSLNRVCSVAPFSTVITTVKSGNDAVIPRNANNGKNEIQASPNGKPAVTEIRKTPETVEKSVEQFDVTLEKSVNEILVVKRMAKIDTGWINFCN